jgi:hemolysin III
MNPELSERRQSGGEEVANSVSHGLGFVAMLIVSPYLMHHAARVGTSRDLVGASIFIATIFFLYLASTVYHALPDGKVKHVFRILEHMAIFVLIAGTYTPFALSVLRGPWGWTLFGVIWALAGVGLILKAVAGTRYPAISLALYLLMGWVALIAIHPLWQRMPHRGLLWLFLGGLAYTGGVMFYASDDRLRYGHFVWHLFVIAGTLCHCAAVFGYAF